MEKENSFSYHFFESLDHMPADDRELVESARDACRTSYSPFSNFRVGAAARLRSGRVITASNQESPVFPAGICAERNLLVHHQAHFISDPVETLAIASDPSGKLCSPCGICRQVLADTEARQKSPIKIIMTGGGTATVVNSAENLMPFLFEM